MEDPNSTILEEEPAARTPQVPSKYLRNYVIKKPNQMAVYVDLLAYLSIVITSQTKYSEPPSQGSIWETCEIFEENRKKKEIREKSKVRIKGMIKSVIACRGKIEPLGTLVCFQQECWSTVQRSESGRHCWRSEWTMWYDSSRRWELWNKIHYIIIVGNFNKSTVQRRESSRRCWRSE